MRKFFLVFFSTFVFLKSFRLDRTVEEFIYALRSGDKRLAEVYNITISCGRIAACLTGISSCTILQKAQEGPNKT